MSSTSKVTILAIGKTDAWFGDRDDLIFKPHCKLGIALRLMGGTSFSTP